MKNFYNYFSFKLKALALVVFSLAQPLISHAQFIPGNLVVLRVGDGISSQNSASTAVYLDEYTPAGTLVSSTPLNASGTDNKLTNSGTSTSEGMLTLSANGQYLVTAGYNAEPGVASITTSSSATIPRTVARIGSNKIPDISTVLPNAFSGGNIRSAASLDGSSFFLAGSNGGVRYATSGAGSSSIISPTITNTRVVHVYRNQVYFSTGSGATPGIYVVGAASNTSTGQVASSFINTGVVTTSNGTVGSPYGFVLLDRDATIPGIDAAYIADDGIGGSAGGIQKWSFDGTTWTKQGTIGAAYRGLTGTLNSDGNVIIYATTPTSAGGNQVVVVTDTNPYNAAPSTTLVTTRITAVANQALRGVDFTPGTTVALPVELTSFTATHTAAGTYLHWTTASELNSKRFEVERSIDGRTFTTIASKQAGGTTAQPSSYTTLDKEALASLSYYRLKQVDWDNTSNYSPILAVAAGAGPQLTISPSPASESISFASAEPTDYIVLNTSGQQVRRGTTQVGTTTLNVASLPTGIYFLELRTTAGRVVRKFSK
jgi:hypothetical protein